MEGQTANIGTSDDISVCLDRCLAQDPDYKFFGLQYNVECFCSKSFADSTQYGPSTACNDYGRDGYGGRWSINLYEITAIGM